MDNVTRPEDLLIWQKARRLVREIYSVTEELPRFREDYVLKEQIRRTVVSVMSHLAQGFDSAGHGDIAKALADTLSACADIRAQLYVALDAGRMHGSFRLAFQRCHGSGRKHALLSHQAGLCLRSSRWCLWPAMHADRFAGQGQ